MLGKDLKAQREPSQGSVFAMKYFLYNLILVIFFYLSHGDTGIKKDLLRMVMFLKYLRASDEMYLSFHLKKRSLANCLDKVYICMDECLAGRSSVVTQSICQYVTIDKNGNSGVYQILLLGTVLGAALGDLAL